MKQATLERVKLERGGHIVITSFKTLDGCTLRTVWSNGFSAKLCRKLRDHIEVVHENNVKYRSFHIPAGTTYAPRFMG